MTNIHMHLFTMDHTPPIQLVYMVKDILRAVLPVWLPLQRVDEKKRMPLISLVAPIASPFVQSRLDRFVHFLTSVSEIRIEDLAAHETTSALFTRGGKLSLRRLVRTLRRRMRNGDTFEGVVVGLVTALYQINNSKVPRRLDQRSLLATFLRSINTTTPYDRLVVHSMDFDNAFRYSYNPGFPSPDVAGFDYRFPRLPFRRLETGHLASERSGAEGDAATNVPDIASTPAQNVELIAVAAAAPVIASEAGYSREIAILPFYCMDPRSYKDGSDARAAVAAAADSGYCGIKIYSPLGYLPEDPRLQSVFALCIEDGLPVLAHCGRGGAGHKGAVNHSALAHPYNWIPVLDRLESRYADAELPRGPFRLCLAHFDSLEDRAEVAWWDEILNLILKYIDSSTVSIYVDVSANYPSRRRVARRYFRRLSNYVFRDPRLETRVLFGSDWWMQLFSVSEPDYRATYFQRYAGRRYYPQPGNGQTLEELFEENARAYLGDRY